MALTQKVVCRQGRQTKGGVQPNKCGFFFRRLSFFLWVTCSWVVGFKREQPLQVSPGTVTPANLALNTSAWPKQEDERGAAHAARRPRTCRTSAHIARCTASPRTSPMFSPADMTPRRHTARCAGKSLSLRAPCATTCACHADCVAVWSDRARGQRAPVLCKLPLPVCALSCGWRVAQLQPQQCMRFAIELTHCSSIDVASVEPAPHMSFTSSQIHMISHTSLA